ncbi:hypothetical protein M3578_20965, partial [Bacillus velezensis]|nr:hypothetical protein [Bacillus velezensis]
VHEDGSGRVALGGVAPKPWRVASADAAMRHGAAAVANALMKEAQPTQQNAFKIPLVERTLAYVMEQARG